jgi:type I site-specific restriction endonuclease
MDNKTLKKACETLISKNINNILKDENFYRHILDVPFENVKNIFASDHLAISNECDLVVIIEKYLAHRDKLPLLADEKPGLDWSMLTSAEKEAREKAKEEEQQAEALKKAEESKAEDDAYNALDDLGKINADWAKKVKSVHKESAERLQLKRLSKAEKKELFKTVRYSFLEHEELLKLTANPVFELAKEFVIEGLSVKLASSSN